MPVELERTPLELLAQLLRHAGEVLTKDELLESVWNGRIGEIDVDDALLLQNIADFANGDPDKRPPSARVLAER